MALKRLISGLFIGKSDFVMNNLIVREFKLLLQIIFKHFYNRKVAARISLTFVVNLELSGLVIVFVYDCAHVYIVSVCVFVYVFWSVCEKESLVESESVFSSP